MEPKGDQKDTKRSKRCSKSSLGALELLLFFYVEFFVNWKNDHGALGGLTQVKGTSEDKIFFKSLFWKKVFSGT